MNHPLQCRCGTLKGHVVRLMKSVIGARLTGASKHNPLFDAATGHARDAAP